LRLQHHEAGSTTDPQEEHVTGLHKFPDREEKRANRVNRNHEASYNGDLGCRTFRHRGSAQFSACPFVILPTTRTTSVLPVAQDDEYVGPMELVDPTNILTDEPIATVQRNIRYHRGGGNLELEQAVIRAAQQHHVQPALLLAVMKAESSFNPIVVSKAG